MPLFQGAGIISHLQGEVWMKLWCHHLVEDKSLSLSMAEGGTRGCRGPMGELLAGTQPLQGHQTLALWGHDLRDLLQVNFVLQSCQSGIYCPASISKRRGKWKKRRKGEIQLCC